MRSPSRCCTCEAGGAPGLGSRKGTRLGGRAGSGREGAGPFSVPRLLPAQPTAHTQPCSTPRTENTGSGRGWGVNPGWWGALCPPFLPQAPAPLCPRLSCPRPTVYRGPAWASVSSSGGRAGLPRFEGQPCVPRRERLVYAPAHRTPVPFSLWQEEGKWRCGGYFSSPGGSWPEAGLYRRPGLLSPAQALHRVRAASCQSVHAPRPPGPGHPTPTAEGRSRAGGGRGKEGQTC